MRVTRGSPHLGPEQLVAGPHPHGAQLVQAERPAALAHALLDEQRRTTAEADQDDRTGEQRQRQDTHGQREADVERPFRGGRRVMGLGGGEVGEPRRVDLRRWHVAEDVLVERGQLGVPERHVQAPGERLEHRQAPDAAPDHEEIDRLAHDGLAQVFEIGDDGDLAAAVALHVDPAEEPMTTTRSLVR